MANALLRRSTSFVGKTGIFQKSATLELTKSQNSLLTTLKRRNTMHITITRIYTASAATDNWLLTTDNCDAVAIETARTRQLTTGSHAAPEV